MAATAVFSPDVSKVKSYRSASPDQVGLEPLTQQQPGALPYPVRVPYHPTPDIPNRHQHLSWNTSTLGTLAAQGTVTTSSDTKHTFLFENPIML